MRALITGATGFIGSHLSEWLLKKGFEVHCLIRKTSNLRWIRPLQIRLIEADFSDSQSLNRAVAGMDYIFHLGAVINSNQWETHFRVNFMNTKYLIEACLRNNLNLKKFVLVSSIAAMGPGEKDKFMIETDPCKPRSLYGKSKRLAEKIVLKYKDTIPTAIIRPPNVLGPRQREIYLAAKLIKMRLVPRIGNEDKQTSLCYVGDLVEAIRLVAEREEANGQIYLVTDSNTYAWKEISDQIAKELGTGKLFLRTPYSIQYIIAFISEAISTMTRSTPILTIQDLKSSRHFYWLYDDSKIRRELGFISKTDMKQAVRKTIQWYRDQNMI